MVCCLPACVLILWRSSTLSWCDGAGGESEANLGKFLHMSVLYMASHIHLYVLGWCIKPSP